jgi:hypothetical protein
MLFVSASHGLLGRIGVLVVEEKNAFTVKETQ